MALSAYCKQTAVPKKIKCSLFRKGMNIAGSLQGQAVQTFLKNGLDLVDLGMGRSRSHLLALVPPLLSSRNLSRTMSTACSVQRGPSMSQHAA